MLTDFYTAFSPACFSLLGLYLAIAVLAFAPLHTLRVEGVLLTVLLLLGFHVALRLMFAIGAPSDQEPPTAGPPPDIGQQTPGPGTASPTCSR